VSRVKSGPAGSTRSHGPPWPGFPSLLQRLTRPR